MDYDQMMGRVIEAGGHVLSEGILADLAEILAPDMLQLG